MEKKWGVTLPFEPQNDAKRDQEKKNKKLRLGHHSFSDLQKKLCHTFDEKPFTQEYGRLCDGGLTDFCLKRQNKVGKIVKKSKFHFFKIHPKMDLDNL